MNYILHFFRDIMEWIWIFMFYFPFMRYFMLKKYVCQKKRKKNPLVSKWFLLIYKYLKGECHLPINLKRWECHFIYGLGKKIYKKNG